MGTILLVGAVFWLKNSLPVRAPQGPPTVETIVREPEKSDEITPEVQAVLQEWERATADVTDVRCQFRRFKYDHTFRVEFRAVGSLSVDRFGTVDYDVRPGVVPRGRRGRQLNTDKQPYDVRPDTAKRIQFTRELITIDQGTDFPPARVPIADLESILEHGRSTKPLSDLPLYRTTFALPPEGADIPPDLMELPLWRAQLAIARPFVLGLSRAEILAKFRVRLLSRTSEQVRLEFIPRLSPMREWYSSAKLILDTNNFRPIACLTVEADGQTETVHLLSDVQYEMKSAR